MSFPSPLEFPFPPLLGDDDVTERHAELLTNCTTTFELKLRRRFPSLLQHPLNPNSQFYPLSVVRRRKMTHLRGVSESCKRWKSTPNNDTVKGWKWKWSERNSVVSFFFFFTVLLLLNGIALSLRLSFQFRSEAHDTKVPLNNTCNCKVLVAIEFDFNHRQRKNRQNFRELGR